MEIKPHDMTPTFSHREFGKYSYFIKNVSPIFIPGLETKYSVYILCCAK